MKYPRTLFYPKSPIFKFAFITVPFFTCSFSNTKLELPKIKIDNFT